MSVDKNLVNIGKETDARAAAEFKWAGQCIRNYETEVYRIIVKAMEYMVSFVGFLLRLFKESN